MLYLFKTSWITADRHLNQKERKCKISSLICSSAKSKNGCNFILKCGRTFVSQLCPSRSLVSPCLHPYPKQGLTYPRLTSSSPRNGWPWPPDLLASVSLSYHLQFLCHFPPWGESLPQARLQVCLYPWSRSCLSTLTSEGNDCRGLGSHVQSPQPTTTVLGGLGIGLVNVNDPSHR